MINPVYYLTKEDRELAEKIGRARNGAKPEKVRYDESTWIDKKSDRAIPHILGLCGEIAYARLTNKKIDENIYSHGDDTDFNGIEVKTSTYMKEDIELKIPETEFHIKTPLAYVLARVDKKLTKVEFIGSISRQKFEKIKYDKCHTIIKNYCVTGNMMKKGLAFIEDNTLKIVYFQNHVPANNVFFSS